MRCKGYDPSTFCASYVFRFGLVVFHAHIFHADGNRMGFLLTYCLLLAYSVQWHLVILSNYLIPT